MASGFFALFDDIALLMDDVAAMSKIATKKTAGILGDDLAVNAEKASGFSSSRELPVLWKIGKGSVINKLIILPLAFLMSYYAPWAIKPILFLGGVYLAYEGVEKIYHYFFHSKDKQHVATKENVTEADIKKYEDEKVRSAIIVDFILSIEIIILTLSTVAESPIEVQIIVVSIISLLATVGVYGVVALLVRMDDFGYKLISMDKDGKGFLVNLGNGLVKGLPWIIRILTVVGTIAMLLVAGGIFRHNIEYVHHLFHAWPGILADFVVGLVVGLVALPIVNGAKALFGGKKKH